jgi:hypothetical protein
MLKHRARPRSPGRDHHSHFHASHHRCHYHPPARQWAGGTTTKPEETLQRTSSDETKQLPSHRSLVVADCMERPGSEASRCCFEVTLDLMALDERTADSQDPASVVKTTLLVFSRHALGGNAEGHNAHLP